MTERRYAVVGGGVSGIAAAHYLQQQGHAVQIIERDRQLGGRIALTTMDNREIELGGKNIGHRYSLFREFVATFGGFGWEHIGVNTARVQDGQLRTIDSSRRIRSFLGQLSRRGVRDLGRFACLVARVRWDDRERWLGGPRFRRLADRTDDAPVSSWFSPEFCQQAWRPMSLLMNAAEPDEIHLGNLGTNVGMAVDDYDQLAGGMGPLIARFAARSDVRLGTTVRSLMVRDGVGLVLVGPDGQAEEVRYDGVILALPAHVSASLLEPHLPSVAAELCAVRYFPTAVVVAEYDRDVFRPDVRALRFEEGDVLSGARAYGKETLNVVRYTFSGRSARPLLEGALEGERLLDTAEALLGRTFPLGRRRRWVAPERALELCAYSSHHGARLNRIGAGVASLPGVHLAGDYLRGASIEGCFRSARDCVDGLRGALVPLGRS